MGRQKGDLVTLLKTIVPNVYNQAPASIQMRYPAIKFAKRDVDKKQADNGTYNQTNRYSVTVIDYVEDGEITQSVSRLPMCEYDRPYKADNLYHDVYTLYF